MISRVLDVFNHTDKQTDGRKHTHTQLTTVSIVTAVLFGLDIKKKTKETQSFIDTIHILLSAWILMDCFLKKWFRCFDCVQQDWKLHCRFLVVAIVTICLITKGRRYKIYFRHYISKQRKCTKRLNHLSHSVSTKEMNYFKLLKLKV